MPDNSPTETLSSANEINKLITEQLARQINQQKLNLVEHHLL